jgi:hypothetical protein
MHCNPDGSASDGFLEGCVARQRQGLRDPGPRAQGPELLGQGGREATPKWIAAAAAAARRTLLTQETQPEDFGTQLRRCKRAEWDPSVGRLLVIAFHSGTVIGRVGLPRTAPWPPTYRMTLMISVMQMQVQMQMQMPTGHAGPSAAMR